MIYNYFKHYFSTMIKKQLLNRQDTLDYLTHLNLPFKLYEHDVVLNMKDMAEKVKLDHAPLVKNLVYADSKAKCFYYVVVVDDAKIEKGRFVVIQVSGKLMGLIQIISDWQKKKILKLCSRHSLEE